MQETTKASWICVLKAEASAVVGGGGCIVQVFVGALLWLHSVDRLLSKFANKGTLEAQVR